MMQDFTTLDSQTLIDWTRRIARLPSEQTGLMEADPAILSFIRDGVAPLLAARGITLHYDRMGNLIAEAGPEDGALELAFFAYAMTHPRSTMPAPFEGELLEGDGTPEIRGRGVSEQKASLTATLAAFLDLAASGALRHRLAWLLLTAGETGRHDAITAALQALGTVPRRAIVAIGTNGLISLGNRGRQDMQMTIEGRACHSSTPWLGVDVTRGVRLVLEQAERIGTTLGRDPLLGPATLICTAIRTTPEATHTVQSVAHLTFDRRLLPGEDPQAVFEGLRGQLTLPEPLLTRLERGPFMHGCRMEADAPFVRIIRDAVSGAGLPSPGTYHSDGALDAGYLTHRGAEAVMWGPGHPSQFHTDDERVPVPDLLAMARGYRAVAAGLVL